MGFNDILKSLFGNKSDRDLKELLPIASKVNAEWEKIKGVNTHANTKKEEKRHTAIPFSILNKIFMSSLFKYK